MCGFAGYTDARRERPVEKEVLVKMAEAIAHRGPDSSGYFIEDHLGIGFRRLSIIDLEGGDQPILNEDGSIVLVCNGEIYNYRELRADLIEKGHSFRTNSDVEVLLHLYEEEGVEFLNKLNGQFAFAIYDRAEKRLFLARDHFGINPLYYTVADGVFIFASEIKAILEHPLARREVDLTGLDQMLSFPSVISPRTMFKDIRSLPSGHFMVVQDSDIKISEYWDLDYPKQNELADGHPEEFYVERLRNLFEQSVTRRLQADVPVGFYLSGGLDSSMIAAAIHRLSPHTQRHSFSVGFTDREICETKYQRLMAEHVNSIHHEINFDWTELAGRLRHAVYHAECPLKETYNTASLALSETARGSGVKVVLNGEGSDEMFAGYIGYRFDRLRAEQREAAFDLDTVLEEELRERLWGDKNLFYEKDQHAFREVKAALYADAVKEEWEQFDCLSHGVVNKERLKDRHPLHQRSYLDFKLRLAGHLIADHGDRMAMAHSIEARYPFLDIQLLDFVRRVPPDLKLNQFTEKYILKKAAEDLIPQEIIRREKFAFVAPGSPFLLQQNIEWVNDLLSFETIKRQGYFNPQTIERLKARYGQKGFKLSIPHEDDLLILVLTFGLFLEQFRMPNLN